MLRLTNDYKYDIQERACEIAEERHGMDFYALTDSQRQAVYTAAERDWISAISGRE